MTTSGAGSRLFRHARIGSEVWQPVANLPGKKIAVSSVLMSISACAASLADSEVEKG
jgi:hypothetical protein